MDNQIPMIYNSGMANDDDQKTVDPTDDQILNQDPNDDGQQPGADPLAQEPQEDEQIERSEDDETESPNVQGEESASGSASKPSSDDDVGEMMEEVTGSEPKPGQTLAEQVDEAERARRGMPPKEDEEQEEKDEEAA